MCVVKYLMLGMGYYALFWLPSIARIVEWRDRRMKQLLLVVFVTFPTIISFAASAWSPLDGFEHDIESMQQCSSIVAASEADQDGNKKGEAEEEEEEPDCD